MNVVCGRLVFLAETARRWFLCAMRIMRQLINVGKITADTDFYVHNLPTKFVLYVNVSGQVTDIEMIINELRLPPPPPPRHRSTYTTTHSHKKTPLQTQHTINTHLADRCRRSTAVSRISPVSSEVRRHLEAAVLLQRAYREGERERRNKRWVSTCISDLTDCDTTCPPLRMHV